VDDPVARQEVRAHDPRAADPHLTPGGRDGQPGAGQRGHGLVLHHLRGAARAAPEVTLEHPAERRRVAQQRVERARGQRPEGLVRRGEEGEGALTAQGAREPRGLDRGHERLEGAVAARDVHERLVAAPLRRAGRPRREQQHPRRDRTPYAHLHLILLWQGPSSGSSPAARWISVHRHGEPSRDGIYPECVHWRSLGAAPGEGGARRMNVEAVGRGPVLLTGATGFVGGRLLAELRRRGVQVRAGARGPVSLPGVEVTRCDLDEPGSVRAALEGCSAAFYLVHAMGAGHGYERRELEQARAFAAAAAAAGTRRIIYLGGPAPAHPSPHLRSRLAVGEALRDGPAPALELRASMIVGHGSTSWRIVRDLSTRLPVMLLPAWTRSRSQPVAIDDVVAALAGALELPPCGARVLELPGPEALSVRELLERVARALGRRPRMLRVPLLSPRLSALWLRFVSGAPSSVAEELVLGLEGDLLMTSSAAWAELGVPAPTPFDVAVARALEAEALAPPRRLAVRAVERLAAALSPLPVER
jgi:uncharacterized protein YbjT (DUF2867 family)